MPVKPCFYHYGCLDMFISGQLIVQHRTASLLGFIFLVGPLCNFCFCVAKLKNISFIYKN